MTKLAYASIKEIRGQNHAVNGLKKKFGDTK